VPSSPLYVVPPLYKEVVRVTVSDFLSLLSSVVLDFVEIRLPSTEKKTDAVVSALSPTLLEEAKPRAISRLEPSFASVAVLDLEVA
jgi:hypothetical protein